MCLQPCTEDFAFGVVAVRVIFGPFVILVACRRVFDRLGNK
jgi:hypothetical protein